MKIPRAEAAKIRRSIAADNARGEAAAIVMDRNAKPRLGDECPGHFGQGTGANCIVCGGRI